MKGEFVNQFSHGSDGVYNLTGNNMLLFQRVWHNRVSGWGRSQGVWGSKTTVAFLSFSSAFSFDLQMMASSVYIYTH